MASGVSVARLRLPLFVSCVSDYESGSSKVTIVAGQPCPGIRSLPHSDVTGMERWSVMLGWVS